MGNDSAAARRYLLHHRHEPDECGVAFASFRGHQTLLRHTAALSSCRSGGHAMWLVVDAPTVDAALGCLPFFVAARTTATEVSEIPIP